MAMKKVMVMSNNFKNWDKKQKGKQLDQGGPRKQKMGNI